MERIKKFRIKLFDTEGNQLSDRLVDPEIEFRKGPKEPISGAVEMEVNLSSKEDWEMFKAYLEQLEGLLPINKEKAPRGRKRIHTEITSDRDSIQEALSECLSVSALITKARELGFVFTQLDYLRDLEYPIRISKFYENGYTFMVRLTKVAKNPLNNKYDPTLILGIKEDYQGKVAFFKDEDIVKLTIAPADPESIKVPAKFKMKFPVYMQQHERNTFRVDMDRLKKDETAKPTRLYIRWLYDVISANENKGIEFPRTAEIPNPYK